MVTKGSSRCATAFALSAPGMCATAVMTGAFARVPRR
jgi:hypothetical protein